MKCCPKCGVEKAAEDFPKDKSKKDGLYPMCKACRAPKTRAQYAANQHEERKRRKARYDANPEKFRAESRAFREANPEYFKSYLRTYYAENRVKWITYAANRDPGEVRAYGKAYREANREKVRAGVRDWHRRHPHVARQASYAYRAKIAALPKVENTLTSAEIDEILEFFDFRCGYCLVDLRTLPKGFVTLDHMQSVLRGGPNTAENVIPCCRSCNSRKKDRSMLLMASYL